MEGDQPAQLPQMQGNIVSSGDKDRDKRKHKLRLSLDYRVVVILLLLVIAGMLVAWKPWVRSHVTDRTVSVSGEATLKATPDEYIFSPSYDFTNADKQTALNALTQQSATVIAKLKSLGVTDSQIKTDTSGAEPYFDFVTNSDNTVTYTLEFTVTVDSSSLSQKIQDYLATTSPSGSVSPDAQFSDSKQKSLDNQARDVATKDARAKAEQSAKNLGFKLGAVKSVTDGTGFANPLPLMSGINDAASAGATAQAPSLSVQPGQNELNYTVNVVYYIY